MHFKVVCLKLQQLIRIACIAETNCIAKALVVSLKRNKRGLFRNRKNRHTTLCYEMYTFFNNPVLFSADKHSAKLSTLRSASMCVCVFFYMLVMFFAVIFHPNQN